MKKNLTLLTILASTQILGAIGIVANADDQVMDAAQAATTGESATQTGNTVTLASTATPTAGTAINVDKSFQTGVGTVSVKGTIDSVNSLQSPSNGLVTVDPTVDFSELSSQLIQSFNKPSTATIESAVTSNVNTFTITPADPSAVVRYSDAITTVDGKMYDVLVTYTGKGFEAASATASVWNTDDITGLDAINGLVGVRADISVVEAGTNTKADLLGLRALADYDGHEQLALSGNQQLVATGADINYSNGMYQGTSVVEGFKDFPNGGLITLVEGSDFSDEYSAQSGNYQHGSGFGIYSPTSNVTYNVNKFKEDVTRAINYKYSDGTVAATANTDTKNFTGTAIVDSGNVNMNWDSISETFAEVVSPKIQGYTADKEKIAAQSVAPTDADLTEDVVYTPNKQVGSVTYYDETNGKELEIDDLNGVTDEKSSYTTADRIKEYEAAGYELVSDDFPTSGMTFDNIDGNSQDYKVVLKLKSTTPSTPGNPSTPTTPGTPSTPGNPSTPTTPGTPSTPSTPNTPGTTTPSTPGTPGTPTIPGNSTPDTPTLGGSSNESSNAGASTITGGNNDATANGSQGNGNPFTKNGDVALPETAAERENDKTFMGVVGALAAIIMGIVFIAGRKRRNNNQD